MNIAEHDAICSTSFKNMYSGIHIWVYHYTERIANKVLVPTLPALRNFEIIARHKGLQVVLAAYYRSGRGRAAQHRR